MAILCSVVIVPSVAYQLMAGVIIIAVAMTPIGVLRLRRMDLVEKVKRPISMKRTLDEPPIHGSIMVDILILDTKSKSK